MQDFIRHFRREGEGLWRCIEPAEVSTPAGRIQVTPGMTFTRGTRFMNFDVAAALEEQLRKGRPGTTQTSDS